jgi:DNA-binding response OmpR family regulator
VHSEPTDQKCQSARNGPEGLARALAEPVDLIVLAVMLPGKSGFEVSRELRPQGRRAAVLMLWAEAQLADCVVGIKFGADDYAVKPFEPSELLARIEALLRRV